MNSFPFWHFARIPYKNGGRDRSGADCWGLLVLIFREVWEIELPIYTDDYRSAEDIRAVARVLREKIDDGWRRLEESEEPMPGDAVVFAPDLPQLVTHVGIIVGRFLGDLRFMHIRREGMSSTVESLSSPVWRAFSRGIYRNLELEKLRCLPLSS